MRLAARCGTLLCLGVAAAMLTGCPDPNTYGTPRTLDPGKVQVVIAPEAFGATYKDTNGQTQSGFFPTTPTVGMRVGVANGIDIGARAPNLAGVGVDGKFRLLKGGVDLAIDPGAQFNYFSATATNGSNSTSTSIAIVWLHLPLLVGFNVSHAVSIVATPGFVYGIVSGETSATSGAQGSGSASSGVGARLGLGFDFRLSNSVALHPEVTGMRFFGNSQSLVYSTGLGIVFVNLPDYSDIQ